MWRRVSDAWFLGERQLLAALGVCCKKSYYTLAVCTRHTCLPVVCTHQSCVVSKITHSKARYTPATKLNSTRSTFVESRLALAPYILVTKSTVSATKSTATNSQTHVVADLLPVSATFDFQQSRPWWIQLCRQCVPGFRPTACPSSSILASSDIKAGVTLGRNAVWMQPVWHQLDELQHVLNKGGCRVGAAYAQC